MKLWYAWSPPEVAAIDDALLLSLDDMFTYAWDMNSVPPIGAWADAGGSAVEEPFQAMLVELGFTMP